MIQWKCPSCGCEDLKISVSIWVDLIQYEEDDNFETDACDCNHEFNDDSEAECRQCCLTDKLRGFRVPPPKGVEPPERNCDGTVGWDHILGPLYTGFEGHAAPMREDTWEAFRGTCVGVRDGELRVRDNRNYEFGVAISRFTFSPATRRQIYDAASAAGCKASFVGVSKDKGVKMLQLLHRKTTSLIRAKVVNPIVAAYPEYRCILEWADKLAGCTLTDGTKII